MKRMRLFTNYQAGQEMIYQLSLDAAIECHWLKKGHDESQGMFFWDVVYTDEDAKNTEEWFDRMFSINLVCMRRNTTPVALFKQYSDKYIDDVLDALEYNPNHDVQDISNQLVNWDHDTFPKHLQPLHDHLTA